MHKSRLIFVIAVSLLCHLQAESFAQRPDDAECDAYRGRTSLSSQFVTAGKLTIGAFGEGIRHVVTQHPVFFFPLFLSMLLPDKGETCLRGKRIAGQTFYYEIKPQQPEKKPALEQPSATEDWSQEYWGPRIRVP